MKTENSPPLLSKHGKQITGLCKTAFSPSGPFLCPGRLPHSLVLLYTRFGTLAVGVPALFACLVQLSQHHNQVSVHFKGCFPNIPLPPFRNFWKTEHPALPLRKTAERSSVFARPTYTEFRASRIIRSPCPNAAAGVKYGFRTNAHILWYCAE